MAHNSPWHHTYAGSLLLSLALHHFFFSLYYTSSLLTPKNMTELDWLTRDAGFRDYLKRTGS